MTAKWFFDVECYPNVFMVGFSELAPDSDCKFVVLHEGESLEPHQKQALNELLYDRLTFGFNSINYDIPMIEAVLRHKNTRELYELSKSIIEGKSKIPSWKNVRYRHVDLIRQVLGIPVGLKMYGARLHFPVISELPYDPDEPLNTKQIYQLKIYNMTDIELTKRLFNECIPVIATKTAVGKMFGVNVLNARSSQVGETIIKKVSGLTDIKCPQAPLSGRWSAPNWLKFRSVKLNELLTDYQSREINPESKTSLRAGMAASVDTGSMTCRVGVGGLHSTEKTRVDVADDDRRLFEIDVRSYYPSLIRILGIGGNTWGGAYSRIYTRRIDAVDGNDKPTADALKLVLNSTFGKLGDKYSSLYSPHDFINITLTGQFALLMLIESLEDEAGIELISANTDSVTVMCEKSKVNDLFSLTAKWETDTGLQLDKTEYSARYSRDVNNYLAVHISKESWKGKGLFSTDKMQVNPFGRIIVKALVGYWVKNIPIESTVYASENICDFVMARKVNGGAEYDNDLLGTVIRWVWVRNGLNITYAENGNLVPQATNCLPVQSFELAAVAMKNLDRSRYIAKTNELLELIQPTKQPEQTTLL